MTHTSISSFGKVPMRNAARAIVVAALALVGAVLLSLSVTMTTTAVQLLASYALKGTQIPGFLVTSDPAIQQEALQYGGTHGIQTPVTVVQYPASWRPFTGLLSPSWNQSVATGVANLQTATAGDPAPVIFGYSQGAIVASQYKKAFNANPVPGVNPTFVLLGNGDRPNGGVLARFSGLYVPILDMTFTSATPTTTAGAPPGTITTTDIAGQYDPIADSPTNPLNPFAEANSAMGLFYVHLNYANINQNNAVLQDQYGDTAYYLIPTYPVPLLMPLEMVPVIGPIAADTLDPFVRVLVESGYNRTISPGQPTTANFFYFPNPIALGGNLLTAIPTGLDNGLQDIGIGRALGTTRPQIGPGTTGQGAYGIGGPPVTMNPTTNNQVQAAALTQPQQQQAYPTPPNPPPPSDPKPGPKLGLINNPFVIAPGNSSAPSTSAVTSPSGSTLTNPITAGITNNPITAGINAVTSSIKSALGGLSKVGASGGTG